MPVSPLALPSLYLTLSTFGLLAAYVGFQIKSKNSGKFDVLKLALQKKLGGLYLQANEIGLASEYLPEQNERLATHVAAFFEKLMILDRAFEETEKLYRQKQSAAAIDGMTKCLMLSEILEAEAREIFS